MFDMFVKDRTIIMFDDVVNDVIQSPNRNVYQPRDPMEQQWLASANLTKPMFWRRH